MSEKAVFVRASNMDYIIFAIQAIGIRIAWTTRKLTKWRLELDHYYRCEGISSLDLHDCV